MTPSERKRFIFINFTMSQMNEFTDDIYEALADNDVDGVLTSMSKLLDVCEHLKESISDDKAQTASNS